MLRIAKILKSNGVNGQVLMGLRDIELEQIDIKEPLFIIFDGLEVPFFIEELSPKGLSKAIVKFDGVDNLQDAEEIVGREVFMDAEFEEEDEEDFTGWKIYNKGQFVGEVTGMEPIPGNLCIYIEDIMIPLHEDFIISCDPDNKTLDLDIPDGLIQE
ncbi:MAG TPA: hypothetical protein DHU72_00710 [Rikenellaceae bacterium]|nr:hypothetical protein [Rikenellaceae bacterium]